MSGMDWTIIDTETTGIAAPIYTLEIAAQRMRGLVPVGKPFQVFLNHEVDVPREAQAVHGYSRKFLQHVRRRMIWNSRSDFGAERAGSSVSGYAA
jgi:DNA polymerase III epsilon subunit-like protein